MSEPRMKSAWEIAMEKAEKLGKPSEEELRKMRRETYGPIGQGLAKKYLSGLPVRDLQKELAKYAGEEKTVVLESLTTALRGSITLDSRADADRVLEAWRVFKASRQIEQTVADIKDLLADYEKAIEGREAGAAQEAAGDLTRQLEAEGISGSALVVNAGNSAQVTQQLDAIKKEYAARLAALKEKLTL